MNRHFLSHFLKGVFSTGLGTLATVLLGFINITIAVRMVSKEQFGTYLLLQVVMYALVMVSDAGLNLSATRAIACAGPGDKSRVIGSALSAKLALSGAVALLLTSAGPALLSAARLDQLVSYLVPLTALYALENLFAANCALLQGLQYYRKLGLSQVALSLLNTLALVALLQWYQKDVYALIYARQLSLLLALGYQYHAMRGELTLRHDSGVLRELFRFGYPLGLNNVLSFIFMRIDTLLIGALLSPVSVAYYGTASKIPDAGRQMFESFRSVYFPNVAELFEHDGRSEAEQVLNNSLRAVTFVTTLCLLLVYLFREQIVTLLFTRQYLPAAPVLAMLMLALVLSLIGYTLGTSLVAAGYSKLPVLINIVDTTVTLLCNLLLIPRLGIAGAGYAAILARLVSLPVNLFFLKRCRVQVRSLEYLKPLFIVVLCILLSSILPSGLLVDLTLIVLYLFLCVCFAVITRDDYHSILKSLKVQRAASGA